MFCIREEVVYFLASVSLYWRSGGLDDSSVTFFFQIEGLLTGYLQDETCWRLKPAAADGSRLLHANPRALA